MFYNTFSSSLGTLTIVTDGSSITEIHIQDDKYFLQIPKEWELVDDHPLLLQANNELQEYLLKKRTQFTVPLALRGTAFQKKVWAALQTIPVGETVSYMEIAKRIGKPEAIRAVGTAIGRNPLCIIVPCHRVMGSDGKFHGYVAGVARKKFLLELEGKSFPKDSEQLGFGL